MQTSSYQDYLISQLENPHYAATYLETHLENEADPEPDLLHLALVNVSEALRRSRLSPQQAAQHRQKLEDIFHQPGLEAVHRLSQWLDALGLKP